MKKNKIDWLLLLFPLLTVLVASGTSGVIVFDGENTAYFSWHQVVEQSSFGWCAPMAVVMNYVVFAFAVVYKLRKKEWCLKGILVLSLAAGCVAALPIVIQSDVKVVPNAMGILLLLCESLVAYFVMKKLPDEKENTKKSGKRLQRH